MEGTKPDVPGRPLHNVPGCQPSIQEVRSEELAFRGQICECCSR